MNKLSNANYTGNQISSARKRQGLTQKELAEKLSVTNKAVSKWERGINYPDIELLKPLSEILDITVLQLLSEEEVTAMEAVEMTTEISVQEKNTLKRDLKWRWVLTIAILSFLMSTQIYLSYILAESKLFGLPLVLTTGLLPMYGGLIGIALFSLRNINKS